MSEELITRIRNHAAAQARESQCAPASVAVICKAENELGFSIPMLLRQCYLRIGNGGFGPGYGVIGLAGGYESDYGDVVATHALLKSDQESEGNRWPEGMLPFCEWGCNIFSCVDYRSPEHPVHTFEDFTLTPQNYDLNQFFELWLAGTDILSHGGGSVDETTIINPFTGQKATAFKRRPEE